MDWSRCIICQSEDTLSLRFPQNTPRHETYEVYKHFLENVAVFKSHSELPAPIRFGDQETPESFLENKASWHKTCHQKFNNSKKNRLKRKHEVDINNNEGSSGNFNSEPCFSDGRKSKRQSTEDFADICLFCGMGPDIETMHEFSCFRVDKKIKEMATVLQDGDLISKTTIGDLVSNDSKYHTKCYVTYLNKYRSFLTAMDPIRVSEREVMSKIRMIKARAFVELAEYMEAEASKGVYIFKLKILHQKYKERLDELDVVCSINRTRLKEQLLLHFKKDGLQENTVGTSVILAFQKGIEQLLKDSFLFHDYDEEALLFAKVSKICRDDIFKLDINFSGTFEDGCQEKIAPKTRMLLSMILYGPSFSAPAKDSQACLTLTQLAVHNCKKTYDSKSVHQKHTLKREPPLPLFTSMNLHLLTRSKLLVTQLASFGIGTSYDRIMQFENSLAISICKQYRNDGIVCPSQLRKGIFTVGAFDNLDHNPSSTTSQGSFHGTGISLFQQPTKNIPGVEREAAKFEKYGRDVKPKLPESYTFVPAVYLKPSLIDVPETAQLIRQVGGNVYQAIDEEEGWIENGLKVFNDANHNPIKNVSWPAYHASRQKESTDLPAITALLPMFNEKSDSPSMVKHAMNIVKKVTEFLNPGQIPVIACDCPIFAKSKYIQWKFPETHGEDKLIMMMGGLHIEKALLISLGDLLNGSGWVEALTEAGIASSGTSESFLKASHIMKTRHFHQVTAFTLGKLQRSAYEIASNDEDWESFEQWQLAMIQRSPTFKFWDLIKTLEILVFVFVRAHREKKFDLYVEVLDNLMFLFFALDHYNYSRWVSVHLRDMKSIQPEILEKLKDHWVINKSHHRFSAIPIDQTHEQENAKVKDKGGAVGLTENPEAFKRWMISGPEQARLIASFENQYLSTCLEDNDHHHKEGLASQNAFKKQVISLTEAINNYGNPFLEDCPELIILHSRECVDDQAVSSLHKLEKLGMSQYREFCKKVLYDRTRSIHEPLKLNKIYIFKKPKHKANPKASQLASAKNDVNLFGQLYIATEQRGGNPSTIFTYENEPHPPSISQNGKLRSTVKSDLIQCFGVDGHSEDLDNFDCKIFDGGALIHTLPACVSTTFKDFAESIFLPLINRELQHVARIDIVWDQYAQYSIKESTRIKRGTGIRLKVGPKTKIPRHWKDFLLDSTNKTELFNYLSGIIKTTDFPEDKTFYITNGEEVISKNSNNKMGNCKQEEADSRIVVHIIHAVQCGAKKIVVKSVDTDVLVILVSQFFYIKNLLANIDLWLAFGTGKDFCYYSINSIALKLGTQVSNAIPMFFTLTGCDSTSSFYRKGKKIAWLTWKSYPEVTDTFLAIRSSPFQQIKIESREFRCLERFVILMYDKNSTEENVNEARRELFSKKSRNLENLPPTRDALLLHINRAIYQASIWFTSHESSTIIPSPVGFGWKMGVNQLDIIWMTQPEAAKACVELIKCTCKREKGCRTCKCAKLSLKCTNLCNCLCVFFEK